MKPIQPRVQKPTVEEIDKMLKFFQELDEEIVNSFSTSYKTDWDKFEDYFNENLAGSYVRVLMTLVYLLENVTDQSLDYLEFKPIIKQLVGSMNSVEIQENTSEKPDDWDTVYNVEVDGKTLEAMKYISCWALKTNTPSFSVIAASDCVFCWQDSVRKNKDSKMVK